MLLCILNFSFNKSSVNIKSSLNHKPLIGDTVILLPEIFLINHFEYESCGELIILDLCINCDPTFIPVRSDGNGAITTYGSSKPDDAALTFLYLLSKIGQIRSF